jgi:hypothetical protein
VHLAAKALRSLRGPAHRLCYEPSRLNRVNAEVLQHGGRANIWIMTVGKMLSREFDDSDKAVEKIVDAGWFASGGLVGQVHSPRL